jgi:hypothetical protein
MNMGLTGKMTVTEQVKKLSTFYEKCSLLQLSEKARL